MKRYYSSATIGLHLLFFLGLNSNALFFRRRTRDDGREQTFSELFALLREIYVRTAHLKPSWTEQWENRLESPLPPKYQPELFDHPEAIRAAQEMRFAAALLHQNRWRSKVRPLFETIDQSTWIQLRGTLVQANPRLLIIQDERVAYLRVDEVGWIGRTVEDFDEVRYELQRNERNELPAEEFVARATYGTLLTATQLSNNLIERLRYDAENS